MSRGAIAGIIVTVVVLILGGWFVVANQSDDENNQTNTESTSQTTEPTSEPNNQNTDTPTDVQTEAPSQSTVSISDFAFKPASLTVKKGTTVTWTNQDDVQHSVVPDAGDNSDFEGGPLLAKGETYEWTFDNTGTYEYHCGPHPQMTGTVVVTE